LGKTESGTEPVENRDGVYEECTLAVALKCRVTCVKDLRGKQCDTNAWLAANCFFDHGLGLGGWWNQIGVGAYTAYLAVREKFGLLWPRSCFG
jgi:hypothetical protein